MIGLRRFEERETRQAHAIRMSLLFVHSEVLIIFIPLNFAFRHLKVFLVVQPRQFRVGDRTFLRAFLSPSSGNSNMLFRRRESLQSHTCQLVGEVSRREFKTRNVLRQEQV